MNAMLHAILHTLTRFIDGLGPENMRMLEGAECQSRAMPGQAAMRCHATQAALISTVQCSLMFLAGAGSLSVALQAGNAGIDSAPSRWSSESRPLLVPMAASAPSAKSPENGPQPTAAARSMWEEGSIVPMGLKLGIGTD